MTTLWLTGLTVLILGIVVKVWCLDCVVEAHKTEKVARTEWLYDSNRINKCLKEHADFVRSLHEDHDHTARRGERHDRELDDLKARVARLENMLTKTVQALLVEDPNWGKP